MEIKHQISDSKGSFYIGDDSDKKGEMTYSRAGENLIIIDHTEVADDLKGKGAGKQMLMKAVEWARENKVKILPLCPFAKSVFDKDKNISDVLN